MTLSLLVQLILFCFILVSYVDCKQDDFTCEPGYGTIPTDIRTSGLASQCSGLSKITTPAECKLAAEYNRENNIDKNEGYGGRVSSSRAPPGCYYSGGSKYYWNIYTKSTAQCSNSFKCICKPKTCIKCPINTYSEGDINPICTPCPNDRPITKDPGQTSVDSCVPLKCEAGYGTIPTDIRTSGLASQCSGISKITTPAECKLAAEYNNRKNNIDKNEGYGGRKSGWYFPPGCFYYSGAYKYYWNDYPTSTTQCSNGYKCICKTKTCIKCPINTYSEGGINPTCTPCPKDTPYTATNLLNIFTSINSCAEEKDPLYCEAGTKYFHVDNEDKIPVRDSDTCTHQITTEAECKLTAEYNRKNNIDKNKGYGDRVRDTVYPPGCYYLSGYGDNKNYYFNDNTTSTTKCNNKRKCICRRKTCRKCPINQYSAGGAGSRAKCQQCVRPFITDEHRTKCYNPEIANQIKQFKLDLVAQKEKQNDLSIKNSRLWQKEQIRKRHDELMEHRKDDDNMKEKNHCKREKTKRTIVFPAIEISNEIELNEDTTCIDTNRDELLKSFCSFRMDLDNLFQIQNVDEEAKTFWPNICCKERKDKTLEACEDPNGKIERENIIPFALSQGGDYSRHNLYVEVADTIKQDGYLQKGMINLLESLLTHIKRSDQTDAKDKVNTFFEHISLCGPRIIDEPGSKDKTKLCQLFIPYQHAMTQFYNLIHHLFATPIPIQESSSLIETSMEKSLLNRQSLSITNKKTRLGKNRGTKNLHSTFNPHLANVMASKAKDGTKKKETCAIDAKFGRKELAKMKTTYCKGSNGLDLSNTNVKNIALYFLDNEISTHYTEHMISVEENIRYDVDDTTCPSKLFQAKDISIQKIAMDTNGTAEKKEWVAVVHLNTESENGYLQSELPYCDAKNYLINAKVHVKAYIDNDNCCKGYRDFKLCKTHDGCEKKLIPLNDVNNKHFVRHVRLTGSDYEIVDDDTNRRKRRRLFTSSTRSASGSCANRL